MTGIAQIRGVVFLPVMLITALLVGSTGRVHAQPPEAGEYTVKAAYLYNFTKFVEWPESSFAGGDTDIVFCILGRNRFGGSLEAIRGKAVGKRKVAVKQIEGDGDMRGCHVLFISDSEAGRLGRVLDAARAAHTLTVSDMPQFHREGGMIALFTDAERVRFSINAGAAGTAGLKISSHLLKLAVMVIE